MKSFLTLSLLLFSTLLRAQLPIRVYAYQQEITPGMVRQRDIPGENGDGTQPADPLVNTHYYIYAVTRPRDSVQFTAIWIRGQWYAVAGRTLSTTPVKQEVPVKKTLVPLQKGETWQLHKGDSLPPALFPSHLYALKKKNELIIAYTYKGRNGYIPVKKISLLEKLHAP